MKTPMVVIVVLAVAACNQPEPVSEQPREAQFDQELRALDDSARNLAFRNAIRDFGVDCERVDKSGFQEPHKRAGMWVAHCTDTGDYAIFVNQRGYAQVARCPDLVAGPTPACKPLPAASTTG